MGCDPKESLICELELLLNQTRRKLVTSQCLNFVLEQHSNELDMRLGSAMVMIKELRDDNHRSKSRPRSAERRQVVITEEVVAQNGPVTIDQVKEEVEEEVFSSTQSPNLLTKQLADSSRLVVARVGPYIVSNRGTTTKCMDISMFKSLNKRKIACPYCPQKCCSQNDLRRHLRHHTGEKPFQCPVEGCDTRFTRKFSINKHLRTVHIKSPLKCSKCPFSTESRLTLAKHAAVHCIMAVTRCDVQEGDTEFEKRDQIDCNDDLELETHHKELITGD